VYRDRVVASQAGLSAAKPNGVARSSSGKGCAVFHATVLLKAPSSQPSPRGGRGQSSAGACVEWITAQPYPRATDIPPNKKTAKITRGVSATTSVVVWVERSPTGCSILSGKGCALFHATVLLEAPSSKPSPRGGRGQSSAGACVEWITAQPYPRATEIPPSKKPRRNHPRGFCYRQKVIRP